MVVKLIYNKTLRDVIGLDTGHAAIEEKITRCIEVSTTTIENLLGRKLNKAAYTEITDSKKNFITAYSLYGSNDSGYAVYADPRVITVKNYPIDMTEDFKIYFDVNGVFDESTLLDSTKYTVDAELGLIWLNVSTPAVKRALKIVYTAGYEAVEEDSDIALQENLPADLLQAAIWQAQHVYDKNSSSNINSAYSGSYGASNSTRYINAAGITPEAMAIIAQYKRPKVAVF